MFVRAACKMTADRENLPRDRHINASTAGHARRQELHSLLNTCLITACSTQRLITACSTQRLITAWSTQRLITDCKSQTDARNAVYWRSNQSLVCRKRSGGGTAHRRPQSEENQNARNPETETPKGQEGRRK